MVQGLYLRGWFREDGLRGQNLNMVLTITTIKTIHNIITNRIISKSLGSNLIDYSMLWRHIKMMLPLNLNPQLNATSALWTNDSTLENITDTYSEIWLTKILKLKGREEQDPDLLSSAGGERLGLVVEEEERLGLALVMSVFNCTNVNRGVPS